MRVVNSKSGEIERRYLYLPMICRENLKREKLNLYEKMGRMEDKPVLEQVYERDEVIDKMKRCLHLEKKALMRKLLIENKVIPSTWKAKLNFGRYVEEAFKDETVVRRFAVHIKNDADKKRYNRKVFNERMNTQLSLLQGFAYKNNSVRQQSDIKLRKQLMPNENSSIKKMNESPGDQLGSLSNRNENKKQSTYVHTIKEETQPFFLITQKDFPNKERLVTNKPTLIKSLSSPSF